MKILLNTQEIQNFLELLRLAAISNTEQIIYNNFARDAQASAPTAKEYFQILEDTLIGTQVYPFKHTKKRKAVSATKFYFFDCGVVNSLLNRKEIAEGTPEYGKQLEQYIFQEINAYLVINNKDMKLEYWRTTGQDEVDFIVYDSLKSVYAIEVKSKKYPQINDYKGMLKLSEEVKIKRKIIICLTKDSYLDGDFEILSATDFLNQLWSNKIF